MEALRTADQVFAWVRESHRFDEHFIVGIDGVDHVGKSPLARYLALNLQVPAIELDLYLVKRSFFPHFRAADLHRILERAEATSKPIVVEGVFLLHALASVKRAPRALIYVKQVSSARRWSAERLFATSDSGPLSRRMPEPMRPRCKSTSLAAVQESEPLLYRLALYHQEFRPHCKAQAFVEWEAFRIAS